MEKVIITAAITGAELSKKDNPHLPITPTEQAQAARECVEAGAAIIHLHVRDDAGNPSQKIEHFERTVKAIQLLCKPNPIIQFSTGGAVGEPIAARIAPLSLQPEMASFNTGTMNFGEDIFVNSFADMRQLAKAFEKEAVTPEFEIYDSGHLANLQKLAAEELVEPPFHIQFVLGVPGAMMGDPLLDLAPLVQKLPAESTWGVAGIGRFELPLAAVALASGGHVRVGLEDNIYYTKGVLATSSAQLVERVARLAKELGRGIATPDEARVILGL